MPTPLEKANFLKAIPAAQAAALKYGVPASVTLAQWMTESSWGQSELAVKANNYFGIKAAHNGAPETYEEFPTWEYEAGKRTLVHALFAKYPDEAASFEAHARLLATAARYKGAMVVRDDPFHFAELLQILGYSTNPHYAADLELLIRDYNLTQYDPPPGEPAAMEKAA